METSEAEADNTETETEAPDTEMSARKLEELIPLIEAAERVSSEVKLPRSGQHLKNCFPDFSFNSLFLLTSACPLTEALQGQPVRGLSPQPLFQISSFL